MNRITLGWILSSVELAVAGASLIFAAMFIDRTVFVWILVIPFVAGLQCGIEIILDVRDLRSSAIKERKP